MTRFTMTPPGSARPAAVLIALVAATGMAACERSPADDVDAKYAAAAALGDAAALALMETLSGRLTAALAEGGSAHAIAFCAGEAAELTADVARDLGPGWEVKRTTRLARNPANQPDDLELEALALFHAAESAGQPLPEHHVQRTPSGDYRYYRPLRIAAPCLACHGDPASLEPDVAAALAHRYPDDRAVGYGTGDLRGLVRVSIPADAVR